MMKQHSLEALEEAALKRVKNNYGHGWSLIGQTAQSNALAAELLGVLRFAVQMNSVDNLHGTLNEMIESFAERVADVRYAE